MAAGWLMRFTGECREKDRVSMNDFIESAQVVLKAHGLKTDFLQGHELAMYRYETPDRHIEVVVRPRHWTVSYVHVSSQKAVRVKGNDVGALEKALRPLCGETAFEPPTGDPVFDGVH